jgi:hypothetical protein
MITINELDLAPVWWDRRYHNKVGTLIIIIITKTKTIIKTK